MTEVSHQTVRLARGRHRSPDEGVCVMELASMLAGEPFGDHPQSVCPVLGEFLRTYNDGVDDDRRADLYAYAAAVVGTRAGGDVQRRRVDLCIAACRHRWWRWMVSVPRLQAPARLATRLARRPERHREALALLDELIALRPPRREAAAPPPRTSEEASETAVAAS